jgi:hypothetical protein
MTVRAALAAAARELYRNSWRLLAVNTALSAVVLAVVTAAVFAPPALVLLPLAGPFVAALAHCAVLQACGEDATFREATHALRTHARRGLLLGAAVTVVVVLGEHAYSFYAGRHVWVLAALVLELLALFALHQLVLWILVAAEPERPLRELAREAALWLLRRPAAALGLAFGLVVVDAAATAAGILPFLMLGGAYSFLAAAHLVLPQPLPEEAAWQS